MSEFIDTIQVRDDAEHWDALAERIAATASRDSKSSSLDWLANSRASWIAASLLLLAAWASLMIQAESPSAGSSSGEWAQALAPADDIGKAIIVRDRPPAIGALLLGDRRGGDR